MTVNTEFFQWSNKSEDPAYNRCSPNLVLIGQYLGQRFAMTNNGCYVERAIRGGTVPSAHSHGAATDRNYPDRLVAKNQIIPFLIDQSKELHIQAIHDYFGSRIWKAGRTSNLSEAHTTWWKPNDGPNMGEPWATYIHVETTLKGWGDTTAILVRLGGATPPADPPPVPPSGVSIVFPRVIRPGDEGPDVAMVQTVIRAPGAVSGSKSIIVDGKYGAQTVTAVKNIQGVFKLTQDGIIGPQTQAVFLKLANS